MFLQETVHDAKPQVPFISISTRRPSGCSTPCACTHLTLACFALLLLGPCPTLVPLCPLSVRPLFLCSSCTRAFGPYRLLPFLELFVWVAPSTLQVPHGADSTWLAIQAAFRVLRIASADSINPEYESGRCHKGYALPYRDSFRYYSSNDKMTTRCKHGLCIMCHPQMD